MGGLARYALCVVMDNPDELKRFGLLVGPPALPPTSSFVAEPNITEEPAREERADGSHCLFAVEVRGAGGRSAENGGQGKVTVAREKLSKSGQIRAAR